MIPMVFLLSLLLSKERPAFFENLGCPENALCSKKAGEKRAKWFKYLDNLEGSSLTRARKMDDFRKKHGIPVGLWSLNTDSGNIIRFDSPCKQHGEDRTIHLAYTMAKDFKKLKKNKNYLLDTAHILQNNRIKTYFTPRGTIPLFMMNEGLVFIQEDRGHYYYLKVDSKGGMRIVDGKQSFESSQKIACPGQLIDHFKKSNKETFYRGYFCHALWHRDTQKFKTMLFAFACQ